MTDPITPQPEPEGLTDEKLIRVYQAAYQPAWERGEHFGCHADGLRAVLNLALCARPITPPPRLADAALSALGGRLDQGDFRIIDPTKYEAIYNALVHLKQLEESSHD